MDRRLAKVLILSAIGIFFIIIWVRFVDMKGVVATVRTADLRWVAVAVVSYLLGILVRAYRWKKILAHLKKISTSLAFNLYMVGQLLNFLVPLRIGEVMKSVFLKEKEEVKISKSFPTVIVDKVLDFVALLIVLVILFFMVDVSAFLAIWAFLILTILGIAFLIYSMKRPNLALRIIHALLFFYPSLRPKLLRIAKIMLGELNMISEKWQVLLYCFFLSLLGLIFDAGFFYALLRAIRLEHISLVYAFLGYSLILASYAIPTPPAQIGSNEILFLIVFSVILGMDEQGIAAITILTHAVSAAILVVGGIISVRLLQIDPFKKIYKMPKSGRS